MYRTFVLQLIITICLVGISSLPVEKLVFDLTETDDYPSDTHGGAVKAFSQLVSDDSSKSKDRGDDRADVGDTEKSRADDGQNSDLKMDGFEDSDESEAQYSIEEFYGYTYDEATEPDFDDGKTNRGKSNSKSDDES